MAACAVLVAGFEGYAPRAYHDKLAKGLGTYCYGETENVDWNRTYTKEECMRLLEEKLPRYWYEIEPCIHVPLSDNEKIAYTSFAYNLGSGATCHSTFMKKLNAGDHVNACEGMLVYNRTRSVGYVSGLDKRRHKEASVCLTVDKPGPVKVIVPLAPKPHEEPKLPPPPKTYTLFSRFWHWLLK